MWWRCSFHSTRNGTWTRTTNWSTDFKSVVSAIPPPEQILLILIPFYFGANLLYLNEFFNGTGFLRMRNPLCCNHVQILDSPIIFLSQGNNTIKYFYLSPSGMTYMNRRTYRGHHPIDITRYLVCVSEPLCSRVKHSSLILLRFSLVYLQQVMFFIYVVQ